MIPKFLLPCTLAGSIAFAATALAQNTPIPSSVVSQEAATKTAYPGAVLYQYFLGETVGTTRTSASLVVVEPGRELHPAHKHAEEEFLLIVEGEGRWSLNGRTFKAKAGDFLYAAPWDDHGLFNSGTAPLKFVVWKWNSKGVPPPSPAP